MEAMCDPGCVNVPANEQSALTFTYTLSGDKNTLTISGTKGDEKLAEALNGMWTKSSQ